MNPAYLRDSAQLTMHSRARLQSIDERGAEIARVLHRVESALSCNDIVANRLAEKLAEVLARECRTEVVRGRLAQWQIEKVDAHIRQNLHARLMVDELADQAALSVSHFTKTFKATFGEPPHARIMRMRIEHAQLLLRTTDLPLSEISLACGLSDQAHLCRQFRRVFGTTPNAWRRALPSESRHPRGGLPALSSYQLP